MYAVWPHSSVSLKSLKYIWSAVVPVGTALTSSAGLTQARVVQSGDAPKGQWVEERVNVAEDYRARFGARAERQIQEVAMDVLQDERERVLAPVARSRFTDRARRRIGPERLVVRAAVVVAGEAEAGGEEALSDSSSRHPPPTRLSERASTAT